MVMLMNSSTKKILVVVISVLIIVAVIAIGYAGISQLSIAETNIQFSNMAQTTDYSFSTSTASNLVITVVGSGALSNPYFEQPGTLSGTGIFVVALDGNTIYNNGWNGNAIQIPLTSVSAGSHILTINIVGALMSYQGRYPYGSWVQLPWTENVNIQITNQNAAPTASPTLNPNSTPTPIPTPTPIGQTPTPTYPPTSTPWYQPIINFFTWLLKWL